MFQLSEYFMLMLTLFRKWPILSSNIIICMRFSITITAFLKLSLQRWWLVAIPNHFSLCGGYKQCNCNINNGILITNVKEYFSKSLLHLTCLSMHPYFASFRKIKNIDLERALQKNCSRLLQKCFVNLPESDIKFLAIYVPVV